MSPRVEGVLIDVLVNETLFNGGVMTKVSQEETDDWAMKGTKTTW